MTKIKILCLRIGWNGIGGDRDLLRQQARNAFARKTRRPVVALQPAAMPHVIIYKTTRLFPKRAGDNGRVSAHRVIPARRPARQLPSASA